MSSLLESFWSVVSDLWTLLWSAMPTLLGILLYILTWGSQVAPNNAVANLSRWAALRRMLSGWMANRRVRRWVIGVAMVLMFVGGMSFENRRRLLVAQSPALSADTAGESVAKCPADEWMPGLEAIKALAHDGQTFYEAVHESKKLTKERLALTYQIEDDPDSPKPPVWQERYSANERAIGTAERTIGRLRGPVVESLYEQLKQGTLIAKGYNPNKDKTICIPRDDWYSLGLGLSNEELSASRQGTRYAGVQIRKAQ